jgi:hypothetical protein
MTLSELDTALLRDCERAAHWWQDLTGLSVFWIIKVIAFWVVIFSSMTVVSYWWINDVWGPISLTTLIANVTAVPGLWLLMLYFALLVTMRRPYPPRCW